MIICPQCTATYLYNSNRSPYRRASLWCKKCRRAHPRAYKNAYAKVYRKRAGVPTRLLRERQQLDTMRRERHHAMMDRTMEINKIISELT